MVVWTDAHLSPALAPWLRAAFGTLTLANNLLGLAAGPVIVGALADRYGLATALQVTPLVAVLAIVALVIGKRAYPASLRRAEKVAAA